MDGVAWNGEDERAFLPTPDMLSSLDVLPGARDGVNTSRSPFSLGVYAVDYAAESPEPMPMRLFYVSEAVVDDRAQTGPPMESGWYLCVEKEGSGFEVRITTRDYKLAKSFDRELPGADVAITSLVVDGENCAKHVAIRRDRPSRTCIRIKGFLESQRRSQSSGETNFKAFEFAKSARKDEGSSASEAELENESGALELRIESGVCGHTLPDVFISSVGKVGAMKPVTEKAAIKKGTSIGVRRDGRKGTESSRNFPYEIVSKKDLQHLTIRVRVRERRWLMSRRVVTATGAPCTKEKAAAILAETQGNDAGPKLKKQKLEPGLVIDLT